MVDIEEHFDLKWSYYSDHLREMLNELMTSQHFSDVTLVSDDMREVKGHRNILSASSPVFKKLFQIDTHNNHPLIFLKGVKYLELESIMQFIYLGEATSQKERINEFIIAARNLEIKSLEKMNENQERILALDKKNLNKEREKQMLQNQDEEAKIETVGSNDIGTNQSSPIHIPFHENHLDVSSFSSDVNAQPEHEKPEIISEAERYPCTFCEYQANTHVNLTKHTQYMHKDEEDNLSVYECVPYAKIDPGSVTHSAPQSSPTLSQLGHQEVDNFTQFECQLCGTQNNSLKTLKKHIQYVHNDVNESPKEQDRVAKRYKTSPSIFNTVDEDRSSSGNNSILVINDVDYEIKDEDCGFCIECKDKTRFGGPRKRRKPCIYREKKRLVKRF